MPLGLAHSAKMQAKYTDLLLLVRVPSSAARTTRLHARRRKNRLTAASACPPPQNKHELTTERQLDSVLDALYELNPETPKLRISRDSPPEPSLVFGLLAVGEDSGNVSASANANAKAKESRVFGMREDEVQERKRMGLIDGEHASGQKGEVETVTVWSGGERPGQSHAHEHAHADAVDAHAHREATAVQLTTQTALEELLAKLPSEDVWRVKGFLRLSAPGDTNTETDSGEKGTPAGERYFILNWAFGRHELVPASSAMSKRLDSQSVRVKLTIMGARGEVKKRARTLAVGLGADLAQ